MTKTKILVGVGGGLVLVLAVGVVMFLKSDRTVISRTANNGSQVAGAQTTNDSAVSQTIPLNQTSPAPASSGGLSVVGNSGSNSTMQASSSQLAVGQQGSSQSQAQSNPFDPTTFKQYEKYKSEQGALYADALVGDGKVAENGKKVAVYYRGWLTDGQVFDQSRTGSDGKLTPFIFSLGGGQVIPGWEQTVAGMKVGGVRLLIVPPAAGYGSTGQGSIPPDSVLIFQVQLVEVE